MARSNNYIPNFTGGEISPRSAARRDLEGFYNSCEYQQNFISDLQGGARFRPGSTIGTEAQGTRLIPFIYDSLDNYWVEVGKWVRIIQPNGQPLQRAAAVNNIWQVQEVEKRTNQIVFHVLKDAFSADYAELITGAVYTFNFIPSGLDSEFKRYRGGYLDDSRIVAINTSTEDATWREVVVSAPGAVAEASAAPSVPFLLQRNMAFLANYTSDEVQRMQFTQNQDDMWLTVGTKPAKKLTRSVAVVGPPVQVGFSFDDATIDEDGSGTARVELTSANNYPYCVAFYENRLFYAHTQTNPGTIWGSKPGLFERFDDLSSPVVDDDAIRLSLNYPGDDINFILPDKDLLYLGTIDGAIGLDGGSSSAALTPTSVRSRPLHTVGTSLGRPFFKFESDLYFVDRGGSGLWRVQYNFNTEKFEPEMISIASDHLTKPSISRASVKNGDDARIFMLNGTGEGVVSTISRTYGARAFARLRPGLTQEQGFQYGFVDLSSLPRGSSQDLLGGIVSDNTNKVIVVFADDFSSDLLTKDQVRVRFGLNEIEAQDSYNGYAYFKSQGSNYLDASSETFDIRPGNITLSALTGTGVTLTSSSSFSFAPGDVGKRISVLTVPSSSQPFGAGIATITAYTSAEEVTVDIEEDFLATTIPQNAWFLEIPEDAAIGLASFFYAGKKIVAAIDGIVTDEIEIDDTLSFDMPFGGTILRYGFAYQGVLKTVNMLGIGQLGTSEGLLKNLHKLRVKFFETGQGTSYGTDYYRLENLDFSQLDDPTDRPPPLFTGEKTVRFDENWEKEKHIYIRHSGGTPCTILALIPFFNTSLD